MLAWTLAGETEAWSTIEELLLAAATDLPELRLTDTVAQKPKSLPWLAVVLLGALANQPPDITAWLGQFERCMGWAILAERAKN